MARIRLGPGGKVLMVLAGLAVIAWGLWAYGALEWLGLGPARLAPAPSARTAAPAPVADASGEDVLASAPGPGASAGLAPRRAPPPLSLPLAREIVEGPSSDADALLARLVRGPEIGSLGLGELVAPRLQAPRPPDGRAVPSPPAPLEMDRIAVVGALPPAGRHLLCAARAPSAELARMTAAGRTVRAPPGPIRLAVAHLADALGADPARLRFVEEGEADLTVAAQAPPGARCVSLEDVGAFPPRLLLAGETLARRHAGAFHAAAQARGALGPGARAFLLAPADDPAGYAHQAAYYRALAADLGWPSRAAPEVATWIVAPPLETAETEPAPPATQIGGVAGGRASCRVA